MQVLVPPPPSPSGPSLLLPSLKKDLTEPSLTASSGRSSERGGLSPRSSDGLSESEEEDEGERAPEHLPRAESKSRSRPESDAKWE